MGKIRGMEVSHCKPVVRVVCSAAEEMGELLVGRQLLVDTMMVLLLKWVFA